MDLDCTKLVDDFIQERRYIKGVTPATLDWYKFSFRPVAAQLAHCKTEQDLKAALKATVTEMMAAGKNPISVNDRIRCWNAWLNWLHQEGFVTQRIRLAHLKEPQKVVPTLTPNVAVL